MSIGTGWARFDDLRAGTALLFPAADRIVVASRTDEVAEALAEVERATDAGRWAFGYVAYEAAAGLDPDLLTHDAEADGMPLVWFGIGDAPSPAAPLVPGPSDYRVGWRPGWTPEGYLGDVRRVHERIAAGDTYQCNLSVRMRGEVRGDPSDLYRDLALNQRGSYNSYLDLGRHVVASASPELFFQRRGDELLLRPMKGTSRRGRYLREDHDRAIRLRSDEKERAENIMIVDLMRNDAARVATTGSVRVPALCTVERYETVLTMTSDVTARLRPGVGLVELFRALFPCGSVTGVPKPRTMEIIRELEDGPRGVYCGAIGWVGPPGEPVSARFSVGIRTVAIDRTAGTAVYGTGGGITWSSDPDAEHAELHAKAAVLRAPEPEFELVETMRHDPVHGLVNGDAHLRRLADSAEYLGFRFDEAEAIELLDSHLAGCGAAVVRLTCTRAGSLLVSVSGAYRRPDHSRVVVDDEPVDSASRWRYHRTTLRESDGRRRAQRLGVEDVVLVNERGELTELTGATLAVELDGRWCTPPISSGCLPGVERARLLAQRMVHEQVLRPVDLARAQRIRAISSAQGWRALQVTTRTQVSSRISTVA
ncbi:chorismate-binding protein [Pseudonocardia spinosispora]|uniref:chorismate-binding protein n=1 Tax=Pseudonocardia spinosispora TaxID=103441 RepID=UPI000413DB50|nr:chorismate-binding protein [Pseudonocardia spinosispora]